MLKSRNNSLLSLTSITSALGPLPIKQEQYRSLRYVSRQGSTLRSDKLRELAKQFAPPLTAFLAAA